MKKNDLWVHNSPTLYKLIMELKIVFLFILVSISNIYASPTYSQITRVSLNKNNATLEQVMDEIEKQSEFYFIFNQKQIDVTRIVNIHAEKKIIADVLQELFEGTDVSYHRPDGYSENLSNGVNYKRQPAQGPDARTVQVPIDPTFFTESDKYYYEMGLNKGRNSGR